MTKNPNGPGGAAAPVPDHAVISYLRDRDRVYETYWTNGRGVERMSPTHGLLDVTVYGRKERWEDSPGGWPQPVEVNPQMWRTNGRPTAQIPRLEAGFSDDMGTG